MSYTIQHFETLRQRFPVWSALETFLESDEGGKIRVFKSEGAQPYAILRYVKETSRMDSAAELGVGLFRSVVWNMETNLPVSFSPPKARGGHPPLSVALSATEDFVDGMMMNAFLERGASSLQIATRSVLGADTHFYSETSFAGLFDACLEQTSLTNRSGLQAVLETYLALVPDATSVFASFVLQHPQHRVVAKIATPSLTCVHVGSVQPSGSLQIAERATNWPQELAKLQPPSYPTRMFHTEQEIEDLLQRMSVQRGWRWQGLVLKDGFGGRWRYRTQTYMMMRTLRGSEASLEARFLRLRKEKRVRDYIKHYSEDRDAMWGLEQKVRERTMSLLAAYSDVHKARAVAFKDLPHAYKPAVFLLHAKWRDSLRPNGFKVRMQNAIEVFNELRPFEQKRLLEAEPYVSVAPAPAAAALAVEPMPPF